MPKPFNPIVFDKCIEIYKKIGRKPHYSDNRKIVVYVALSEYLNTIETDILEEPEYLETTMNEKFKNPNYEIIETIKAEIIDIDKSLRLSFWPSSNERGRS